MIGIPPPNYRLPPSANVGRVRLAVSNLERSGKFYRDIIGLSVLKEGTKDGRLVQLGSRDSPNILLELEEIPGVRPMGQRSRLGLYHTAFLLPSREALSSFVRHLAETGTYFGSADHTSSEAIYLTDPDGLGVEVYADRPRAQWVYEGREIVSGVKPLRLAELSALTDVRWEGAPAGSTVGHVHFYVGELEAAASFYHAALGLDIATWRYPGALFLSAGGYHHHVGFNIWAAQAPPASPEDARLLTWELVLPSGQEVARVAASLKTNGFSTVQAEARANTFSDPWGICVVLAASSHEIGKAVVLRN
jgi:catechol 2,3-dioxygenase